MHAQNMLPTIKDLRVTEHASNISDVRWYKTLFYGSWPLIRSNTWFSLRERVFAKLVQTFKTRRCLQWISGICMALESERNYQLGIPTFKI